MIDGEPELLGELDTVELSLVLVDTVGVNDGLGEALEDNDGDNVEECVPDVEGDTDVEYVIDGEPELLGELDTVELSLVLVDTVGVKDALTEELEENDGDNVDE